MGLDGRWSRIVDTLRGIRYNPLGRGAALAIKICARFTAMTPKTPTLAVEGGAPVRTQPWPVWPMYDEREERALLDVLHSRRWGTRLGVHVRAFEDEFAAFQGARYGICVPNGTLALQVALQALGVGWGDEVITSPYTFIATASAALAVGARPVFVDVDANSLNIDPALIEAAITPRTRAIAPVHIGGRPADMDAVLAAAQRHGLHVLEDACQAWGAEWRGQRVGALGDLGTFSFQSSKNITAGEAGIVVTNDEGLADLCWSLHNVGRIRDGGWYQHERLGSNLRLPEWEGAILRVQLERLPEHMQRRDANAAYLGAALAGVPGLTPLPLDPRVTRNAWHLFMVRYDARYFGGRPRGDFIAALQAEGVTPCSAGYIPLYRAPAIQHALAALDGDYTPPHLPVVEALASEIVWLAQTVLLGDTEDMDSIVEAATKIQRVWG